MSTNKELTEDCQETIRLLSENDTVDTRKVNMIPSDAWGSAIDEDELQMAIADKRVAKESIELGYYITTKDGLPTSVSEFCSK